MSANLKETITLHYVTKVEEIVSCSLHLPLTMENACNMIEHLDELSIEYNGLMDAYRTLRNAGIVD